MLARALALVVAAAVAAAPSARSTPTAHFRGIVYVAYHVSGAAGVWVARSDGTGKRRVLPAGRDPLLSPNGRWIAYTGCAKSRCRLTVIPASGGRSRAIANDVTTAVWTSDSRRVVAAEPDGPTRVELAAVDIATRRRTRIAAGAIGRFSVAPSDDRVCFEVSARRGSDLYVADIGGGGAPRRLTRGGASASPVWGSHGIAFTRLRRTHPLPNGAWGADEIWRIDAAGGNARRVARPPMRLLGSGITGLRPEAWSRDGRRIVAGLVNEFGAPPLAVDVVTGRVRRIGSYGFHARVDGLSRDGRFVLVEDGNIELDRFQRVEVVPYAGGRPTLVARFAGSASWNG